MTWRCPEWWQTEEGAEEYVGGGSITNQEWKGKDCKKHVSTVKVRGVEVSKDRGVRHERESEGKEREQEEGPHRSVAAPNLSVVREYVYLDNQASTDKAARYCLRSNRHQGV